MSAARAERLLNLLTLLLNARRPVSLREIRELDEFDAYYTDDPKSGERAFERDKAALIELGVPLRWIPPENEDDEDGTGGYVIDRERYYLPELQLEPSELALLSLAGAAAAGIPEFPGRAAVVRALAKLGFDVDAEGGAPTVAHAPLHEAFDSKKVAQHLEVLHLAVAHRHRVELRYRGTAGKTTTRTVEPWGLYYRQGIWYLVGYCGLRRAERTFHLGRIDDVKPVGAETRGPDFVVPEVFDLRAHTERRPWEFPTEPPVDVTIRLAPRLVPAIGEIFGRRAAVERHGEETWVRLHVSNQDALIAAVLPYGAAAEVVTPKPLRARLRRVYVTLAKRYREDAP